MTLSSNALTLLLPRALRRRNHQHLHMVWLMAQLDTSPSPPIPEHTAPYSCDCSQQMNFEHTQGVDVLNRKCYFYLLFCETGFFFSLLNDISKVTQSGRSGRACCHMPTATPGNAPDPASLTHRGCGLEQTGMPVPTAVTPAWRVALCGLLPPALGTLPTTSIPRANTKGPGSPSEGRNTSTQQNLCEIVP